MGTIVRYRGHRTACAVCARSFLAKSPRSRYCRPKCQLIGQARNVARQTARRNFLMDLGIPYRDKALGKKGEPPLGLSEAGWEIVSDPAKTSREKWDALSVEDQRKVMAELERLKGDAEAVLHKLKQE